MARTTAELVRAELSVSESEYPSSEDDGVTDPTLLDSWIRRGARVVNERMPSTERDEAHLTDLETLVAAHFAYADVTGATSGQRISSIQEGLAQISYDTDMDADRDGPGGTASPYWSAAVALDSRIAEDPYRGGVFSAG